MNKQMLVDAVRQLVSLLVKGDFDTLERCQMLGPSTKEEYKAALSRYLRGRELLVEPPPTAFSALDVYDTAEKNKWRIDFDLWTDRGLSDLTAQIYVREEQLGTYHPLLYDMRVL